ncbi:P-loop containing nucleoside triphosphate hydrolase protein [Trichoderma longibrachiatum ATCC 18648]|uniref:P-loop containing nucleoside triphosphate hydrolase protein n=1 Tax=Trichoderma longibrachiatum ATCC 18648 TaxID=983965 RepID=A0A2T4C615_TRILO|nr:P-loop containing nucleoside triphosphate hydrolase protein [Trichoderma longibrachiatum ATCC 18648]
MTKIQKEKNSEAKTAPGLHENLFSRFMSQVIGSTSREMEAARDTASAHEGKKTAAPKDNADLKIIAEENVCHKTSTNTRPDGLTVVKYSSVVKQEDAELEQTRDNQGGDAQTAGIAGSSESTGTGAQQVDGDVMPDCSSAVPDESDDMQQSKEIATTTGGSSSDLEGHNDTVDEKKTDDMISEKVVGMVEREEEQEMMPTISSLDVEPTDKIDKKNREEHSSEKKRKEKRSHKRSKSGDRHAGSSKRAKTSKTSVLGDEAVVTKVSGPDCHAKALDIEQARARIPTNCSIRHEYDQTDELKGGKKIAKSDKFKRIMVTELKDHQLTALSWMVGRERESPRPAAGGIIGDEMGLGKTVTSLACIAAHRLNKSDRKKRAQATLVIVPSRQTALQWQEEAKKHWTEEASENVILFSPNNDLGPRNYGKQMIVQLRNQYPRQEFMDALDRLYADEPRVHRREFRKEAKELFRVDWFRVILDESHEVTKWNGRNLKACCAIEAQHRWALSGTPILNKPMGEEKNTAKTGRFGSRRADEALAEFYSYATFIFCNFIGNRRVFKNDYIYQDATNDYFDTMSSSLMYRRTADKNLKIPPTTHQELYVEVSAEEEILCKRQDEHDDCKEKKGMPIFEDEHGVDEVEDSMPEQGKAGNKSRESSARSIQSSRQMRLRQALSHTYCLENFLMGQDYLDEGEFRSLLENLRSVADKKTIIEQLEADPEWQDHLGKYQTGLNILKDRTEESLRGVFDMNDIMSLLLVQRLVRTSECGGAKGHSQDLSRYKYMFEPTHDAENQFASRTADRLMTLEVLAAKAREDKSYVEIGRDSIGTTVQAKNDSSVFFVASSYFPEVTPPPSSRLTATVAVAMTWLTEAPQDKIIVFTQFLPTLKMLGYLFQILGVKFVYYSGVLPKQKQDHAMNAFQNDPKTMVMISTMKSGGQSHNLTVANRVIIVDLWWNKMAEKQAISRVARMGQTKETFSVRIVTKHSMDDRVIEVQTAKEETVARMLQDDGHERTEVDDHVLKRMFEPKSAKEEKPKKRKGVKQSVTDTIYKEESPE